MVHVRAARPLGAKSLNVELAHFFDEVVVSLHMLQLAVGLLGAENQKHEKILRHVNFDVYIYIYINIKIYIYIYVYI